MLYSIVIAQNSGSTVKSLIVYEGALGSVRVYSWFTRDGATREVGGLHGSSKVSLNTVVYVS